MRTRVLSAPYRRRKPAIFPTLQSTSSLSPSRQIILEGATEPPSIERQNADQSPSTPRATIKFHRVPSPTLVHRVSFVPPTDNSGETTDHRALSRPVLHSTESPAPPPKRIIPEEATEHSSVEQQNAGQSPSAPRATKKISASSVLNSRPLRLFCPSDGQFWRDNGAPRLVPSRPLFH